MKYDDTSTGILDFGMLKRHERVYIMESFGEFLSTCVVRFDQFHPISLAVTIRHAVERIYRHRAHAVMDLRQALDNASKDTSFLQRVGSAIMEKTRAVGQQLE